MKENCTTILLNKSCRNIQSKDAIGPKYQKKKLFFHKKMPFEFDFEIRCSTLFYK